jgi:hypothetical protein
MDRPIVDLPTTHPGISMHHIPVEGAVGGLFVLATVLIFGGGIPLIRAIAVVTVPLGILASGILLSWHKRHPLALQTLGLRKDLRKLLH